MKKQYIAVGIAAFAVTLGFGIFFKPIKKDNVAANARFGQVVGGKVSAANLPKVQEYIENVAATKVEPDVCRESREKLLTHKLEEIVADIQDRRTNFEAGCATFDEAVTTKDLSSAIYKNCTRETMAHEDGKQNCYQALVFFKANLVAKSFKGDLASADAETLIYLFMNKITQGEMRTAADFSQLNEITDNLLEIMPDSPAVHKAAAMSRIVPDFENMSKGESLNPEADMFVDSALKLNPGDSELAEVATLRKLYEPGETKISVEKAAALAEEKPRSSIAQYFLAGAFENAGRRDDAIAAARKAHDLEPGNSRYTETLQKLIRGEKRAFMIQLGIGFDSL